MEWGLGRNVGRDILLYHPSMPFSTIVIVRNPESLYLYRVEMVPLLPRSYHLLFLWLASVAVPAVVFAPRCTEQYVVYHRVSQDSLNEWKEKIGRVHEPVELRYSFG